MLRIKGSCDKISTVRSNKIKYRLYFEDSDGNEYSRDRYLDIYKIFPKRGVNEKIEEIEKVEDFLQEKGLVPIERYSDGSIIVAKKSSMPTTEIKKIEKISNTSGEIIF